MADEKDVLATVGLLMKTIQTLQENVNLLTNIASDHDRQIESLKMELARVRASVPPTQKSSILLAH